MAVSKNRGENRPASLTPNTPCIRLPHPDHTRWYLQYKYRKYTQPGSRRTNEKNETDYRLCFSKWWNFFIVTATGNRDTQGKKNNEGQGRKKISGVLPQEESATGKGSFSNWQSKKKSGYTHTNTRARFLLIFNCKKEHSLIMIKQEEVGAAIFLVIKLKKKSLGKIVFHSGSNRWRGAIRGWAGTCSWSWRGALEVANQLEKIVHWSPVTDGTI